MRPRPFKFFFGVAIGLMLLFFVARIFIAALIFAAVASTIYFVFRSMGNFFRNLSWQERDYDDRRFFSQHGRQIDWRENDFEPLEDNRFAFENFNKQERIIQIR